MPRDLFTPICPLMSGPSEFAYPDDGAVRTPGSRY